MAAGRSTRTPTTRSTTPDRANSAVPPIHRLASAPTIDAGTPPTIGRRATDQSTLHLREYDHAPAAELGSSPRSGATTPARPCTPSSASTGVAIAEPTLHRP